MKVTAIRGAAKSFKSESTKLQAVIQQVDNLVKSAETSWRGPDSRQFSQRWQQHLRAQVQAAVQTLSDAASTLERNANAQQQTSDTLDGGAAGSGVPVPGQAPGTGAAPGTGSDSGAKGDDDSDVGHQKGGKDDAFTNGNKKGEPALPLNASPGSKTAEGHYGTQAELDDNGKPVGKPDHGLDPKYTVAQKDFVYGKDGEKKGTIGSGSVNADGSASYKAGAYGDGSVYATSRGIGVEGSVGAGVQTEAQGAINLGDHVNVNGGAKAQAGAMASGDARIDFGQNGNYDLEAGGSAMAGAKVEGHVGADVGGVGANATGEAWAGVGVEANGTLGYKDGHFKVGGSLGAALGVGGKAGFEIDVNVPEAVNTAKSAAKAVAHIFGF